MIKTLTLAPNNVHGRWRQALPPLLLLLAAVLFLYRDTASVMVAIWERSDTFAHAFLVPPIVAWLIWRDRARLAAVVPRPTAWVLPLLAGMGLLWLLGDLVATNAVTQFAFTALLVLTVPAVLGMAAARALLFPLCFLFFAVPIGEFLMPQLMLWTADFTVLALRLSGIPVYREGQQIVIPSGNWSVVEACSGIRYLIASLMVGTLFAYLNFRSLRRRLIFVAVSIVVPIVANWVRAYLIVLLGHVSGNQIAVGADHLVYGWVFFGVVILIMFMIGARWAEPVPAAKAWPEPAPGRGDAPAGRRWHTGAAWAVAVSGVAIAVAPHLALRALDAGQVTRDVQLAAPAALAGGWQLSTSPVADWTPAFQNPAAQLNRSYASQGRQVGLYIGYYRRQDFDHKLVSSENVLVKSNDAGWAQVATGSRALMLGQTPITLRTAELRGKVGLAGASENGLRVWQTYWVNGRFTSSDTWAKVYGAVYRLLGRGDDSAVIIFYAREQPAGSAQEALEAFALANLGAIGARLSAVRDRE